MHKIYAQAKFLSESWNVHYSQCCSYNHTFIHEPLSVYSLYLQYVTMPIWSAYKGRYINKSQFNWVEAAHKHTLFFSVVPCRQGQYMQQDNRITKYKCAKYKSEQQAAINRQQPVTTTWNLTSRSFKGKRVSSCNLVLRLFQDQGP